MKSFLQFLNKSFAWVFPFFVRVQGAKVYYNSLDRFVAACLWKTGRLEGYEMQLFRSFLKKDFVMLDIGANMGVYSLMASPLVREEGKIIAFEPDKDNFQIFNKSILKNEFRNITCHPFAVSDKNEKLFFQTHALNSGNHQIRKEQSAAANEYIEAVCLDDFLKNEPRVDIIKIDIQGAEFFAFSGMKELIRRNPNIIVFAEYWIEGMNNLQIKPAEYLSLLDSFGFNYYKIDTQKREVVSIKSTDILQNPEYTKNYLNLIFSRNKLF